MGGDGDGWRVEFELSDGARAPEFDDALAPLGGAVTVREIDGGPRWRVTVHCAGEPDRPALEARIAAIAAGIGIAPPALAIEPVPTTDWVLEYQRRTPPVTVGCFFIHPSHYRGAAPAGLTGIRLDAGLAFGTGEHATTAGCLRALAAQKAAGLPVGRALDMGCGSAILAIAAALLWPSAAILAVDNDPEAIRTARENVADNGRAGTIDVVEGDGNRAEAVADRAPFDLIVANILAGPLIAMAPDAAARLAPGGRLVLSGLLSDQADAVLAAHAAAGLVPAGRIEIGTWSTLILKPGG
jgi:ribosomal protein L11 methyltransferase